MLTLLPFRLAVLRGRKVDRRVTGMYCNFVISWNGGDVDYVNFKFSSRVCNILSYVYSMLLLEITIVKLE